MTTREWLTEIIIPILIALSIGTVAAFLLAKTVLKA